MGCCLCTIIGLLLFYIFIKLCLKIRSFFKIPELPKLEDTWWGPKKQSEEDTTIKPFSITVSSEVLDDLRQRLINARPLTPPLEGIQHQYGINSKLVNEVVEFWRTQYDWKERENFLNQFPQFKVSIQGLQIHYIHVKPEHPGVKTLPLLLLHGWPGSVREFYEIIPILTTPQPGRNFVFEIIAPSLPGYGFSEAAVRPGLGAAQVAVVLKNLMIRLGFKQFYVQGGDWGGIIGTNLATLFSKEVIGFHSNFCVSNFLTTTIQLYLHSFKPTSIVRREDIDKVYPLSKRFSKMLLETGYSHIQATKPDTVGVALNDSPVGLAAYILEKFITWTNPKYQNELHGGLNEKYNYTKLLDNIMIYWITNSITTSLRLYSESINRAQMALNLDKIPTTVPMAYSRFSHDIFYTPTKCIKNKYLNMVQVTDYDAGHFAAFEEPEILAEDIYNGIEKIQRFNQKLHE